MRKCNRKTGNFCNYIFRIFQLTKLQILLPKWVVFVGIGRHWLLNHIQYNNRIQHGSDFGGFNETELKKNETQKYDLGA